MNLYDAFHIKCYNTVGQEMLGKNVINHTKTHRSIFVSDNRYEIFEIPEITNIGIEYGRYLMLIHNTSFDYWVLTDFEITGNTRHTERGNYFEEFAEFAPYGIYDISLSDRKIFNSKKM